MSACVVLCSAPVSACCLAYRRSCTHPTPGPTHRPHSFLSWPSLHPSGCLAMFGWRLVLPLVSYFVSGVGLTCFNKFLLGSSFYDFGFPVTLILCHMLTNFLLSCLSLLSLRVPLIASALPNLSSLSSSSHQPSGVSSAPLTSSSYYPSRLPFRLFLRRFVPIGILFAVDITLTNVSFKLVPVSLTEVVKGFAPAALMLHTWRMERLKADRASEQGVQQVAASAGGGWYGKASVIVLLSAGIALTSYGDMKFKWNGFFAALGALVAGVLKFVLLEQLLEEEEEGSEEDEAGKKGSEAASKAEDEEAAGEGKPVDKTGKKQGHYQQVNAIADDDEPRDSNADADTLHNVRTVSTYDDQPNDTEQQRQQQSTTVSVELKPIDEERKEEGDTASSEREGRTLHKVTDTTPPLRRRSPVTSSVRHSSAELAAMERGEEPTSFVLSARPASPSAPYTAADLSSLPPQPSLAFVTSSAASSSLSLLKPSPSITSLSNARHPRTTRQHASAHKRLHPLLSLFYFSPVAAIVLVPTFFQLEWSALLYPSPDSTSFVASPAVMYYTLGLILSSAVLAFTLNLSELSLIQSTSALTLCVVATVKFLLVVVLTSVLFEHEVSVVNAVGCCMSVAGRGGLQLHQVPGVREATAGGGG